MSYVHLLVRIDGKSEGNVVFDTEDSPLERCRQSRREINEVAWIAYRNPRRVQLTALQIQPDGRRVGAQIRFVTEARG